MNSYQQTFYILEGKPDWSFISNPFDLTDHLSNTKFTQTKNFQVVQKRGPELFLHLGTIYIKLLSNF